jgi:hypothetical protein
MFEGIYDATQQVMTQTGVDKVNTVGYCIGGTLLSCALAHMAAKGDKRIKLGHLLRRPAGLLRGRRPAAVHRRGMAADDRAADGPPGRLPAQPVDGRHLQRLRGNDLIWSFFINNYLMGKEPRPFDLLFWNADQTRMPKALHLFYLRNFYKDNALTQGDLTLGGEEAGPVEGQDADLCAVVQGRPHRALSQRLSRRAGVRRPGDLHHGRLGPHRRGDQPSGRQQVPALDQRQPARLGRGLAGRRDRASRLVVAALGDLAEGQVGQAGPGPRPRQGR